MSKQISKPKTYKYLLVWVVGLSVALGFFLWLPNSIETLWLRRFDIYLAGVCSLVYVWINRNKIHLKPAYWWIITLLIICSTVGLLFSPVMGRGLIGQPIIHPSLLSLYASISIGLMYAVLPDKKQLTSTIYWLIVCFALLNLVYWFFHGTIDRLGIIGEQINYTAWVLVVGLVIGRWLWLRQQLSLSTLLAGQMLLLGTILLTQSRVAIALSLAVVIYSLFQTNGRRHRHVSIYATIVLLIFIGLTGVIFNRVSSPNYFAKSVTYRIDLIKAALPRSASVVWAGGGVGSLERNIEQNGKIYPPIARDIKKGWRFESSHNYLVDIAVERGLIALTLYCFLVGSALWRGWQSTIPEQRLLLGVLFVTQIFLLFNNANIQFEVVIWCCMLGLLQGTNNNTKNVQ